MYATELLTLIDNISIPAGNEKTGEVTIPDTDLPVGAKIVGILSQSVRNASSSGTGSAACNLYDLRVGTGDRSITYQCYNLKSSGIAKVKIQIKLLYTY